MDNDIRKDPPSGPKEPAIGKDRGIVETNIRNTPSSGMSCPRCEGPIAVGSHNVVAAQFGLLGMLISQFMTSYHCGKIPFREFPHEVRSKARLNMWLGILIGGLVLAGLIILIVYLSAK